MDRELLELTTFLPVELQPGHWRGWSIPGLLLRGGKCCFSSAGWRTGFSSSLRGKVLANHKKPTGDCECEDEMAKICSQCRRRHTSLCAELPQKLVKLALAAVTIPGAGRGEGGALEAAAA